MSNYKMQRLVTAGKPVSSPSPMLEDTKNVFEYDKKIYEYDAIVDNKDLEELVRIYPIKYTKELPTLKQKPSTSKPVYDATLDEIKQDTKITEDLKYKKQSNTNKIIKNRYINIDMNNNEKIILNFYKNNLLKREHPNFDKNYNSFLHFCKNAYSFNRYTWKIISMLNADFCNHSKQYIKTNNETLLLHGSSGGETEDYYFDDIPCKTFRKKKVKYTYEIVTEQKPYRNIRKRGLLTSMNVNFKPGPLCKKPKLNESLHIKSEEIELVNLPRVGLKITPHVGSQIDTKASSFLKHSRDSNGFIDHIWSNFAASVVQSSLKVHNEENNVFTFPIPYENNRSKILMRKDLDNVTKPVKNNITPSNFISPNTFNTDSDVDFLTNYRGKDDIENSVKCVLIDMLRTVYISDIQDRIFSVDPDYINRENMKETEYNKTPIQSKNIIKKKGKFSREFKNLNITIIDVDTESTKNQKCNNEFCRLGCVCSNMNKTYFLNEHCRLPECMFSCRCNFMHNLKAENDELEQMFHGSTSTIINSNQNNRILSKEEKKFQHTIIRSKDKTIVLGNTRRDIRTPKRYDNNITKEEDEYEEKKKQALLSNVKILAKNLPYLKNCATWCMKHNVYRCLCRKISENGTCKINGKNEKTNVCSKDDSEYVNILDIKFMKNAVDENKNSFIQKNKRIEQNILDKVKNDKAIIKTSDLESKHVNGTCESATINVDNTKEEKSVYIKPIKALPNVLNKMVNKHYFDKIIKINSQNKISENFGTIIKSDSSNIVQNDNKTNSYSNKSDVISSNSNDETIKLYPSKSTGKKNGDDPTKLDFSEMKIVSELPSPSKENKYICISWSRLMGHFLLKKIFIWLTKEKPYRAVISLDMRILSSKWVEISFATKDLLEQYPTFVYDIVNNKDRDCHLILAGNIRIWEICRFVNNNVINHFKSAGNKGIEKNTFSTISNKKDIGKQSSASLLKNTSVSKKTNSVENTSSAPQKSNTKELKHWFKIYIGNDFSELQVPSKNFKVSLNNILKSSEIIKPGNIAKIFSDSENIEDAFGVYTFPDAEEFFLGPYETTQNPDIQVTISTPTKEPVIKSWGMWLTPDNGDNKNMIGKLHFASEQGRQETNTRSTKKILNMPPLNKDTKNLKETKKNTNELNQRSIIAEARKSNSSSGRIFNIEFEENNDILVISDSE